MASASRVPVTVTVPERRSLLKQTVGLIPGMLLLAIVG
jgi:hypothetical protein